MTGPFAIGADVWPGLAKLSEEMGELQQVIGKITAYPDGEHPDGAGDLPDRLCDEIADVLAALTYVQEANPLDGPHIYWRKGMKRDRFWGWHMRERRS